MSTGLTGVELFTVSPSGRVWHTVTAAAGQVPG